MSNDIIAKRTYKLGDIELETSETAGTLLQMSAQGRKGPSGWDLSALAVAISASMEIEQLRKENETLDSALVQVRMDLSLVAETLMAQMGPCNASNDLAAIATMRGEIDPTAPPLDPEAFSEPIDYDAVAQSLIARRPGPRLVVPTPEELADDYDRRLAAAQVLAAAGAGWPEVVAFAFHPATRLDLQRRDREPTPTELATIEKWLDQNATRRGDL